MPVRITSSTRARWSTVLLALSCACDDGPRVPFKLHGDAGAEAGAETAAPPARPGAEAAAYSDAVDQPNIDGAALPLTAVRATLVRDLDGDDDRDVIALVHDAEKRLRLVASMRDPQGFRAAQDVSGLVLPGDPTCTLKEASLGALSPDKSLLTLDFVCGEERTALPSTYSLVSTDAPPRVLLTLSERPARPGEPVLGLTIASVDADGDGHHDVVLSLADAPAFRLTFRDRASGLSRDASEPEALFASEAKLADAELAKTPDEAEARVARALSGYDALCREAEAPRVLLGGEPGVPCGKTPSRQKLLVTGTLARARRRDLPGALESYRRALAAGVPTQGKQHDRIRAAFGKLASKSARVLKTGPDVSVSAPPHAHLPAARFVDEDTLVLGFGAGARSLRISTGEEAPVASPADPWLRDPSGQLAVLAAEQGCAGVSLKLVRVPTGDGGYAAREPVATALAIPSGADPITCRGPTRTLSASELTLLGWAPQGIVVARAGAPWVVPLSAEGQPIEGPFALAPDAARPAPLLAGSASRDGARFVERFPVGIAVYGPDARQIELLAPAGYAEVAASTSDVAISPSGQRVALLAEGTLYVLAR